MRCRVVMLAAVALGAAAGQAGATPVMDRLEAKAVAAANEGRTRDAHRAYHELQTRAPDDARACRWGLGAIRAIMTIGTGSEKLAELGTQAARYRGHRNLFDLADPTCGKELAGTIRELAGLWFLEGPGCFQDVWADAIALYRIYLATFPAAPDAGEARLELAALLEERARREKDPRRVVPAYLAAAEAYARARTGNGPRVAEAALGETRSRDLARVCRMQPDECDRAPNQRWPHSLPPRPSPFAPRATATSATTASPSPSTTRPAFP